MSSIKGQDRRVCSPGTELGWAQLYVPRHTQSKGLEREQSAGPAHCQRHMPHPSQPRTLEPGYQGAAKDEVTDLGDPPGKGACPHQPSRTPPIGVTFSPKAKAQNPPSAELLGPATQTARLQITSVAISSSATEQNILQKSHSCSMEGPAALQLLSHNLFQLDFPYLIYNR